ncbi:hypothetical protein ACJX0J_022699, partial [Zea mays]
MFAVAGLKTFGLYKTLFLLVGLENKLEEIIQAIIQLLNDVFASKEGPKGRKAPNLGLWRPKGSPKSAARTKRSGDRGDPVDPFITEPLNFDTRVKEGDGLLAPERNDDNNDIRRIQAGDLVALIIYFMTREGRFGFISNYKLWHQHVEWRACSYGSIFSVNKCIVNCILCCI